MAATPSPPQVLAVTTPGVEGYRIARYLGIVAGEAILGTGFGADVLAGVTDVTRSRVAEWEGEIQRARSTALSEMSRRAQAWGANAVVGVSVDTEAMGPQGSILLVTATGTAVVVEPIPR
ncbi:MAG TPA: heavy metal-binding domain-containing protein [Thermoplasmata archaeon]|nr:heavy metal-binding domain-containing protein [Thermoplasmata archaeon]